MFRENLSDTPGLLACLSCFVLRLCLRCIRRSSTFNESVFDLLLWCSRGGSGEHLLVVIRARREGGECSDLLTVCDDDSENDSVARSSCQANVLP